MSLILYWDNHLLLANKPPLLVTQPTNGHPTSLETLCKEWLQEKLQKPKVFLEAVHRLDREASGVVLFARTSKALSRLQEKMRAHSFTKIYYALIEEKPIPKRGIFEDYLKHGDFKAEIVSETDSGAKYALLEYELVKSGHGISLVKILLKTGRYHQIRCQFASRGYPLLGDKKYGSKKKFLGVALHHTTLTFPHPVQEKVLTIEAPLPW